MGNVLLGCRLRIQPVELSVCDQGPVQGEGPQQEGQAPRPGSQSRRRPGWHMAVSGCHAVEAGRRDEGHAPSLQQPYTRQHMVRQCGWLQPLQGKKLRPLHW